VLCLFAVRLVETESCKTFKHKAIVIVSIFIFLCEL